MLTLLPDYLAVVRAGQIVATLSEGLARLDPVQTADLDQRALGRATSSWTGSKASGPRTLEVLIIA